MKVAKLSRNVKRSSLRLPVAPSHSPASYLIYAQFMWHFAEWSVANGLGHSTRGMQLHFYGPANLFDYLLRERSKKRELNVLKV